MKILVISGYSQSLVIFRGDLIKEMISLGNEVVTASPEEGYDEEIKALGARPLRLAVKRNGTNPFSDFSYYRRVKALIKAEKPDLVQMNPLRRER